MYMPTFPLTFLVAVFAMLLSCGHRRQSFDYKRLSNHAKAWPARRALGVAIHQTPNPLASMGRAAGRLVWRRCSTNRFSARAATDGVSP